MSADDMSFRHRWALQLGRQRSISEGARLMGIMGINEYGKPDEGAEFWPSHKSLAELIGVSERTAERRMSDLVEAGLIEKRSGGFGGSNRYVAVLPNPDTPVGIEAPIPTVLASNPDTPVGQIPTALTDEQTQEHSHLEQIHPDRDKAPCFCSGDGFCSKCSRAPEVEMCEFHSSFPKDSCRYCEQAKFKVKSSLPEWKQEELYERYMADEGLNQYGEPLGLDY